MSNIGRVLPYSEEKQRKIIEDIADKYNLTEEEVNNIWMSQWRGLKKHMNNNPSTSHKIEVTDLVTITHNFSAVKDKIPTLFRMCKKYYGESVKEKTKQSFAKNVYNPLQFFKKSLQIRIGEYKEKQAKIESVTSKKYNTNIYVDELKANLRRVEELIDTTEEIKGKD